MFFPGKANQLWASGNNAEAEIYIRVFGVHRNVGKRNPNRKTLSKWVAVAIMHGEKSKRCKPDCGTCGLAPCERRSA